MIVRSGAPLDDFLADAGASTDAGERLQQLGLFGSLTGLVLATGLLVFLALTHRGSRNEVRVLLRITGAAGALMLVGAAVEIAGVASILGEGWADALTSSSGSAAMMRLLGGLLIVLGLFEHTVPVGGASAELLVESLDDEMPEHAEHTVPVRWVPSSASAFGLAGATIGVFSFGFDGHTVSKGPRLLHAIVNIVHVAAGSVWFGGIVGLVVVAFIRRRSGGSVTPLVVRFSSVATVALVAVALAGVAMSLMILDRIGDLTGTDWGRLLLVKLAAVGAAAGIGAYNHYVVVPALERGGSNAAMAPRARTTVTIEAVVLLFVVVITVLLANASTT